MKHFFAVANMGSSVARQWIDTEGVDAIVDLPNSGVVDGRKMHPMYLLQVKEPAESSGAWDYMKVLATIAPEDAFRPLKAGGCPLVK